MEKEKAELIKKMYELGFEVGFKNHSEIGWVLREYNNLVELANNLGIKSPEIYYHDGKLNGKKSRDKGADSTRAPEKAADIVKKVNVSGMKIEPGETEELAVLYSQKKPGLNEFPDLLKQSINTEVPSLLGGFRALGSLSFRHRKKT